jgi:hypothetical protein
MIQVWRGLQQFGSLIIERLEGIGETIADVIGLDDSKFQYVADSMTDEDWERARAVQQQREEEDVILRISSTMNALESGDITIDTPTSSSTDEANTTTSTNVNESSKEPSDAESESNKAESNELCG